MLTENLKSDLLVLLENNKISFQTVILYGSYAICLDHYNSDIDLVVYSSEPDNTHRRSFLLYDRINVSVNIIGDKFFDNLGSMEDSGWYFISKLLSPTVVLKEHVKFDTFNTKLFSSFIFHFLHKMIPPEYYEKPLSPEQLLALSYQTLFKSNFAYLLYFETWYRSSLFRVFWDQKVRMMNIILSNLDSNEKATIINNSIIFLKRDENYSVIKQDLIHQQMCANFWHFFYKLHENDEAYTKLFFYKVCNRFKDVGVEHVFALQNFFRKLLLVDL